MAKKAHIPINGNEIIEDLDKKEGKVRFKTPAEVGFTADVNPKDNKKEIDVVNEKETAEKTTEKTAWTRSDEIINEIGIE